MIKNEHFLLGYQHHHDEISVVTSHLQPVDIVPMIHCPEYEPMVLIPSTEHSACCSDGQYAAASPSNAQRSVAPVPFSPVNIGLERAYGLGLHVGRPEPDPKAWALGA